MPVFSGSTFVVLFGDLFSVGGRGGGDMMSVKRGLE